MKLTDKQAKRLWKWLKKTVIGHEGAQYLKITIYNPEYMCRKIYDHIVKMKI